MTQTTSGSKAWAGASADSARIGFYGLSYGGETAVRVPPLLDDYALSICSGDFNEWGWKNTGVGNPYSYLFPPISSHRSTTCWSSTSPTSSTTPI